MITAYAQPSDFCIQFPLLMQSLPLPPNFAPELVDLLVLEHASEIALTTMYYEIEALAGNFGLPGDILWALVADWIVSDQVGEKRTPAEYLIPDELRCDLPQPSPRKVDSELDSDLLPGASRLDLADRDATVDRQEVVSSDDLCRF